MHLNSSVWMIPLLHKYGHVTPLLKILQWHPTAISVKTTLSGIAHPVPSMIWPLLPSLACFSPFYPCVLYSLFQLRGGACSVLTPRHCCAHLYVLFFVPFPFFIFLQNPPLASPLRSFPQPWPALSGGLAAPTNPLQLLPLRLFTHLSASRHFIVAL